MTKLIRIPYGRFSIAVPNESYEIDKALEVYDAGDELTFVVQWLVQGSWLISIHANVHWNAVRVAVLQALQVSDIPVMVSVIGGTVIDIQDPDIEDIQDLCNDCGYYMCSHGNCGCEGGSDCGCWLAGEFVG